MGQEPVLSRIKPQLLRRQQECGSSGRDEEKWLWVPLPSAVPENPSALKLLVLFFRRCFLRLACGEGGGSIFGLVVLDILGLEHTESPRPVSTAECK